MENITYKINPNANTNTALKQAANDITSILQSKFGSSYAISADDFTDADKNWSHEIKVRQGNKIGAAVGLKWEKSTRDVLKLDVSESSKMGNMITYSVLLLFLAIGAYMGYNNIEPLAFLPGHKIAAGLGGLIALIPGIILVAILKSILLKGEKEQNAKLVHEVRQALQSISGNNLQSK
ncbi:hypothetical protein [Flavobacterium inviolabile]|uniref:hypothetical protein n=1 Tax=Flavobacterium inviolabile TaxID=2748320 RepID=UPI0015B0DDF7|nr:hypothetical protein [Flavobacterium inviolabile]